MRGSKKALDLSTDMEPVHGSIDVAVPPNVLWQAFDQPHLWPRWNPCFFWCRNRRLALGDQLIWCFEPIRPWYGYKFPAIAKIVELESGRKVTWEVTVLPGFYAQHTYCVEPLPDGRSRFSSWEKAYGWGFRQVSKFWIAHFTFVKDRSLAGARQLEIRNLAGDRIDADTLPRRNYLGFLFSIVVWAAWIYALARLEVWPLLIAAALLAGRLAYAFYDLYVRLAYQRLAPGVHAALNGGGNTLLVEDGNDVLMVDTKFPPASQAVMRWLRKNSLLPVTKVVNTHYHYDHAHGNVLFPAAERFAFERVPEFMTARDGEWWRRHMAVLPDHLVPAAGVTIPVGGQYVELTHLGPGHTQGDLIVRVPKFNVIATGDLIFNGYYMFFDESNEGVDLSGNVAKLRWLAEQWPDAIFMPGHGQVARAGDLLRAADYIEDLLTQARAVRAAGSTERDAPRDIDLRRWNLLILPSFHDGRLAWATAASNAKAAWRLAGQPP
ncbi:MBL fold metallo-hydrolase [Bradyrhizobium sp. 30]|uniref:MBL fold metallo-hydrolase n=1 Tax=Bradyrhizobium sp. 30 TaxID=2782669 RepID=UPI001FFB164D|nr:MBL fold metallo-hydrolase [Bradyrhizobium sp. 30]MCK1291286.1 MBL fold metallo-hydrolase [Bradyrhizobium sp. 30]